MRGPGVTIAISGLDPFSARVLEVLEVLENVQYKGIYAPREDLIDVSGSLFDQERVYASFMDLCWDEEVEAVVICGPAEDRYDQALNALLSGKHVLVDIPAGESVHRFKELRELSERLKLVFAPAVPLLLDWMVVPLMEWLRQNDLENLERVSVRRYVTPEEFDGADESFLDVILGELVLMLILVQDLPEQVTIDVREEDEERPLAVYIHTEQYGIDTFLEVVLEDEVTLLHEIDIETNHSQIGLQDSVASERLAFVRRNTITEQVEQYTRQTIGQEPVSDAAGNVPASRFFRLVDCFLYSIQEGRAFLVPHELTTLALAIGEMITKVQDGEETFSYREFLIGLGINMPDDL